MSELVKLQLATQQWADSVFLCVRISQTVPVQEQLQALLRVMLLTAAQVRITAKRADIVRHRFSLSHRQIKEHTTQLLRPITRQTADSTIPRIRQQLNNNYEVDIRFVIGELKYISKKRFPLTNSTKELYIIMVWLDLTGDTKLY